MSKNKDDEIKENENITMEITEKSLNDIDAKRSSDDLVDPDSNNYILKERHPYTGDMQDKKLFSIDYSNDMTLKKFRKQIGHFVRITNVTGYMPYSWIVKSSERESFLNEIECWGENERDGSDVYWQYANDQSLYSSISIAACHARVLKHGETGTVYIKILPGQEGGYHGGENTQTNQSSNGYSWFEIPHSNDSDHYPFTGNIRSFRFCDIRGAFIGTKSKPTIFKPLEKSHLEYSSCAWNNDKTAAESIYGPRKMWDVGDYTIFSVTNNNVS